jgi:signal transduction histidine kinase
LPLVHRIAQLHGGRLEYRRNRDQTEFTLWLPAHP